MLKVENTMNPFEMCHPEAMERHIQRLTFLRSYAMLRQLQGIQEKIMQGRVNGILDPTEAPAGYFAVLKATVATSKLGNICRACDWRPECQNPETDFSLHNHRCMGYPVISRNEGREIKRNDGCSVVFKRL